jgi:hypothetical protein
MPLNSINQRPYNKSLNINFGSFYKRAVNGIDLTYFDATTLTVRKNSIKPIDRLIKAVSNCQLESLLLRSSDSIGVNANSAGKMIY